MATAEIKESTQGNSRERRKILVVAGDNFSGDVVNYAVHLAERLDYDLLALSVDIKLQGKDFHHSASEGVKILRRSAARLGIQCDHMIKNGDLGAAVEALSHEVKRIEFVVTDSGICSEDVSREVTVPMFSVKPNSPVAEGGRKMAGESALPRKNLVPQTIGYGLVTASLYAGVFMNADTVMKYFTKGGWYAALPIATVFAFSFVHGNFAHNLWSLLGIEALKKDSLRKTEHKVAQKRKRVQQQAPRAYAYVNPFHRIDR